MSSSQSGYWHKRGLIFSPEGRSEWMKSHAQVPTALLLTDRIRVYFASRPRQDVSLTTYVDLDIERPERILEVAANPILDLGGPGSFDEHGIMPSSAIVHGGLVYLYYSGWCRLGGRAPYNNATGVAVSEDEGRTFRRLVDGPVLDRSPNEPLSATSPSVVRIGDAWHILYSSGRSWIEIDGKLEHTYDIRHGTSSDGIHWHRDGKPAIAQESPEEALTRPTLFRRNSGEWCMWYCRRGSRNFRAGEGGYRIGFSSSTDLVTWQRSDHRAGIDVSGTGWDSKMIAYPCVLEAPRGLLMFYNGNDFGRDGFGYAVWTET